MEIILLENNKLGVSGDTVTVKAGYARNYLIPRGIAIVANASNRKYFEKYRSELEADAAAKLNAAKQRAEAMAGVELVLKAKVSDGGKLFGSVGAKELIAALAALGYQVAKHEIALPSGQIRAIGEHEIAICMHPLVSLNVKVQVVPG